MIDMFDVDKTKEISFDEFQQLWAYLGNLREAFDKFDVDKGGAIDAQELTEGRLKNKISCSIFFCFCRTEL